MRMHSTCPAITISLALVLWSTAPGSEHTAGPVKNGQAGKQEGNRILWDFDGVAPGSLPKNWRVAETNGKGKPGKWQVRAGLNAPSAPNVLALTQTENTGDTYNLVLAGDTRCQDMELEVKLRALSGQKDRGGGLIWRVSNPNNYYLARWDPLEHNLRLYFVKAAKRTQIASIDVTTDSTAWHTIRVAHVGNKIKVAFDGKALIEKEDATFPSAGLVGLWTKADASTAFDNLKVELKTP